MNKYNRYYGTSHSSKTKRNMKRVVVNFIQKQNENIRKDDLWRGRFYVQMDEIHHRSYEDGSGNTCYFRLTFIDLATGQTATHWYDSFDVIQFNGWDVWRGLNDFIVEDCKVWAPDASIDPRKDTKVYR